MSFDACFFGLGFDVDEKPTSSYRFAGLIQRKGIPVTHVSRVVATYDDYEQPKTWTETEYSIKLFEHYDGSELVTPAGGFEQNMTRFLASICHVIKENDRIETKNGVYFVQSVVLKRAYKEVWAVLQVG